MSSLQCPPFGYSGEYYQASGDGVCVRQSSFFEGKAVLNQGVGYAVILGFGAFFAVFTSFLVNHFLDKSKRFVVIAVFLLLLAYVNSNGSYILISFLMSVTS